MASSGSSHATTRPRGRLWGRTLLVVVVLAAAVAAMLLEPVRLGLDLRGGTQIVLEAQPTDEQPIEDDTVERLLEVLRRRVDALGVAEPTLQTSGDRRVIVELPGVTDPAEARAAVGRTAQLTFHAVEGVADDQDASSEVEGDQQAADQNLVLADDAGTLLELAPAALTGDAVEGARPGIGQSGTSAYEVAVDFRGQGGDAWRQLTAEAACAAPGEHQRRVAIVLDGEIISSPEVNVDVACGQGIRGGSTSITGDFTQQEAEELALLIRGGALPVPVEVVQQQVIGPTLGDEAIESSMLAAIIGVAVTIVFMGFAYRLYGLVAGVALMIYGLLSYAALVSLGATLTLPGIAGFVLAIGMAVDANVLVFERAKEEHASGHTGRSATTTGFSKALTAVIDSNVTTIIAAVLLIAFASGQVRGFGVTLTIGVAVSMFSALVVTRLIIDWLLRIPRLARRPDVLGLTAWRWFREWLERHQPDLLGRSRLWLTGSVVAVLLAVGGMATQGLTWGLEFTGGRMLEYRTAQPVDVDELRSELAGLGLSDAVVQASDDNQVSIRTSQIGDQQQTHVVDHLEDSAGEVETIRDEFIGPTIGSELRRNAMIALGIALAGQLLYLAVRFRWTYGTAAVGAMLHDVVLLVGVFAWLGKTFDGVFLAALLTVIGYSINDTVVIFDRVRERRKAAPKRPVQAVANTACLETLPRTINTGMGALFILGALYVLGGDTLADFALALIIGTTVGMYSSILVASPLYLTLERFFPQPPPRRREPTTTDDRKIMV